MRKIKDVIRKSIPERIKKFVSYSEEVEYGVTSFSQFGEDMVLRGLFAGKENGFYVDVGAHHPFRFSNTCHFYKQGWRGINIEPMPESKKMFDRLRPRDINVEMAISDREELLPYYEIGHSATNTFSEDLLNQRYHHLKPKKITDIKAYPLRVILERFKPVDVSIDFMSIDVEGFDLKVLQSNDWVRYRPGYILVEDLDFELTRPEKSEVFRFLTDKSYSLVAKCSLTLIFKSDI